MKTARAVADFVLRLAFFVGAPIAIVKAAALFPVGGAIVQIVIALVIFFVGEAARGLSEKYTLARRLLRKQLEFEAYYREHPPRPFLYYVFYPLLFPYWLWNREARRELMLFRGFTILSAIVLVGTLTYQFFRLFPPELGAKEFFPLAAKRRPDRGGGWAIGPELGWLGATPAAKGQPFVHTVLLGLSTSIYFGS